MFHFRANYLKYGPCPTTHDLLKSLALVIMVVDHIGSYFFPDALMLRAVGRTCVPMWFFLIGYAQPRKVAREFYICAAALILADALCFRPILPLNILVSIIFARAVIHALSRYEFKKWQSFYYMLGLLAWMPLVFLFEYGTEGTMLALFGYMVKTQPKTVDAKISAIFATLVFLFMETINFEFDMTESFVMWFGTAGVVAALYRYRLRTFTHLPALLAKTTMFLGRNSLYIYTLHVALFVLLAKLMHPEHYQHFQWI